MGEKQQGISSLIAVLTVVLVVLFIGTGWAIYNHRHNIKQTQTATNDANQPVVAAANNYLISQVGSSNFHKYYTYDASKSSFVNPNESQFDFIGYHFAPIKSMKENDIIRVQVNRNNLQQASALGVPDCTKDSSLCNFKIYKPQALQIANQNNLKASDRNVFWNTDALDENQKADGLGYIVVVSSCSQSKSLFIDYRTGSVMWTEDNCGDED